MKRNYSNTGPSRRLGGRWASCSLENLSIRPIVVILLTGAFLILLFLRFKREIEDFLFFEITKVWYFEDRSLEKYYATFKPFRNWKAENLEIKAQAAVSVQIDLEGQKRFLFTKNPKKILPIASLTKLMTALIVLENYD